MDFNIAYNVHCSIRLQCGREIILDKLIQSRTYAGLLEGVPNKRVNDLGIEWLLDRAGKEKTTGGEPYLIEPKRRDYLRKAGDMQSIVDRQSDRPEELRRIPEWLPLIECIGIFSSISPARDSTKDTSSLTIVWFQDDFGIDKNVVEQLQNVDWEKHAVDCDY
ncbi:MAG: hypothetical protein Q8K78_18020 [Planctomycetaceae bacterium]|nr:hypothetical protein [Planctomycetaceae bacterium]